MFEVGIRSTRAMLSAMSPHWKPSACVFKASLLSVVLGLAGPSAAQAAVSFTTVRESAISGGDFGSGSELAAGDLNRDGHVDFVSVSGGIPGDAQTTVLLGRGDGTFTELKTVPASGHELAVGDVNGDANPDLVMWSFTNLARVALGKGDGTFEPPVAVVPNAASDAGGFPGLVLTDLGGPGNALDIAVTKSDGLHVLINNGDGTFASPVSYPNDGREIVAGDFTGDGHTDLAFTRFIGSGDVTSIIVRPGSASGALGAEIRTPAPSSLGYPVAADLDGDGKLDLAATDRWAANLVRIYHGAGDGTFEREEQFPAGGPTSSLGIGDIDGDDQPDIVVGTFRDGIAAKLATGETARMNPAPVSGDGQNGLVMRDFDGDGADDIVGVSGSRMAAIRTGIVPSLTTDATGLSFSSQAGGALPATQTVTYTNAGPGPAIVHSVYITFLGGGYSIDSTCESRILAVGDTCTVTVGSLKTDAGTSTGQVLIRGTHAEVRLPVTAQVKAAPKPDPTPTPTPTPTEDLPPAAPPTPDPAPTVLPAPPAPPADTTAPTLTLKLERAGLATARSKGLKGSTTCSEACSVTVSASVSAATARKLGLSAAKRPSIFARSQGAAPAGTSKAFRLKPSRAFASALRKARSVVVTVTVEVTDVAGNTTVRRQTVTLKR